MDLLDILPMQASADPDGEPYGIWVMVERATNSVVGDIGFMGPPADGVVEIGFSVVPERRRLGFASEAAAALVDWALGQPGVDRVVARCDSDNDASIGVLERAGFVRTAEADGVIHWRAAELGRCNLTGREVPPDRREVRVIVRYLALEQSKGSLERGASLVGASRPHAERCRDCSAARRGPVSPHPGAPP